MNSSKQSDALPASILEGRKQSSNMK